MTFEKREKKFCKRLTRTQFDHVKMNTPYPVVERVLKKHTQVNVPLPSKKCSVSRLKVLVQTTT